MAFDIQFKLIYQGIRDVFRVRSLSTVIIQGKVRMFNQVFSAGDIVVCEPGDAPDFEALDDTVNVVVKVPGASQDKYLCGKDE